MESDLTRQMEGDTEYGTADWGVTVLGLTVRVRKITAILAYIGIECVSV